MAHSRILDIGGETDHGIANRRSFEVLSQWREGTGQCELDHSARNVRVARPERRGEVHADADDRRINGVLAVVLPIGLTIALLLRGSSGARCREASSFQTACSVPGGTQTRFGFESRRLRSTSWRLLRGRSHQFHESALVLTQERRLCR